MAADRDAWRHSILKVADEFERNRIDAQEAREAKGKLEPTKTLHRTSLSPVDTVHGRTFPSLGPSVTCVPAVDVNTLHILRSRSHAIILLLVCDTR